jgi:hypothetical protein
MNIRKLLTATCIAIGVSASVGCNQLKQLASALIPSEYEMALALRQALEQGLTKTFQEYSNPSANTLIGFAFPGDADKVISTMNKLGLSSYVNQTTTKFNKAIGSAFTAARPIFTDAIKKMSFTDAAKILLSDNQHAATDYFKAATRTQLMNAFRPIVDSTIKLQGADKDWSKIANAINSVPFTSFKVETSLTDFVAARAVDGMYILVANEEQKIRTDLNFRTTDLMKRVFGYADEQKKKQQ